MNSKAQSIIEEVASKFGVDASLITSHCRKPLVYYARMEVARRLREREYSTLQIGELLNHDHTTIVFYLGNAKKKPRQTRPSWRAPRVRHLYWIKPAKAKVSKSRKAYLIPYAGACWSEYQWKRRPECPSCP